LKDLKLIKINDTTLRRVFAEIDQEGIKYLFINYKQVNDSFEDENYTTEFNVWIEPKKEKMKEFTRIVKSHNANIYVQIESDKFSIRNIKIGFPPFRLDIVNQLFDKDFYQCFDERIVVNCNGLDLNLISFERMK